MRIISLFSGCGGLDLGFQKAGFSVVWANEKDSSIWETYTKNHSKTELDKRDIKKILPDDIPNDIIGIIGGPPCQSWSLAGNGEGVNDSRGRLFYEFIRILKAKKPLFVLAENVLGMMSPKHKNSLNSIKREFSKAGYNITFKAVNAADYLVPQNRKRVFFIGYRKDLNLEFFFPENEVKKITVKEAIYDLRNSAIPALKYNATNGINCIIDNHEYWLGDYSYIFMSRNRVLDWQKPAFTIQANGRHIPLHPKAPPMVSVEKDIMKFKHGNKNLYRRLTIRECARLQTFPDNFILYYNSLGNGYKMVGNAVPINLSYILAKKIYSDISQILQNKKCNLNMDLKLLKLARA